MASTFQPPSSALSRSKPIVLSIAGVATAYAIYLILSSQTNYSIPSTASGAGSTTTALHRSNAVRRPRRSTQNGGNESSAEASQSPQPAHLQTSDGNWRHPINGEEFVYNAFATADASGVRQLFELTTKNLMNFGEFLASLHFTEEDAVTRESFRDYQASFVKAYLEEHMSAARRNVDGAVQMGMTCAWLTDLGISPASLATGIGQYSSLINSVERDQSDGHDAATTRNVPRSNSHLEYEDSDGLHLKQLLYAIAEEQSNLAGYKHRGVICNSCATKPIRGTRWRCSNCPDYDLCSNCHALGRHNKTHIFYEVRIPAPSFGSLQHAQPVAYFGAPQLMPGRLPDELTRRFLAQTNFEKSELDGLYDQFTCLVNFRWDSDPNNLGAAIDREGFDRVFVTPPMSLCPPRPNLIYDRVFAFYDSDADGLIGFEEFLSGLACIHDKSKNSAKVRKVFEGYDADGDGFISRKDFLRMFKAFYSIQKDITRDLMAMQEEELTAAGKLEIVDSALPLSAAFSHEVPHRGERGPLHGKQRDRFGDRRSSHRALVDHSEDVIDRETVIGNSWESRVGMPFDGAASEPLSAGMIRASVDQEEFELRFTHEGRSIEDARREAVRERQLRRQFYTDEEEGVFLESQEDHRNGHTCKDDAEEHPLTHLPSQTIRQTAEGVRQVSSRSRSSSKVRFQDDVEFETRSNTSASSRPFNERYGGYDIVEVEKDFGAGILYQVAEDGMNELLDVLFKEKEDLSMEVLRTKCERWKWRNEIATYQKMKAERSDGEKEARDPLMALVNTAANASRLQNAFSPGLLSPLASLETASSDADHVRVVDERSHDVNGSPCLCEICLPLSSQREAVRPSTSAPTSNHEASESSPVNGLPGRGGTRSQVPANSGLLDAQDSCPIVYLDPTHPNLVYARHVPAARFTHLDPTMPQNRANDEGMSRRETCSADSSAHEPAADDVGGDEEEMAQSRIQDKFGPGATGIGATEENFKLMAQRAFGWSPNPEYISAGLQTCKRDQISHVPDDARLAELVRLETIDREARARGGPGRLSFEEFRSFMEGPQGRAMGFIEAWLELGSI